MSARDGEALLDAIRADPGDDLVRLAYADWCEENGDGDRAEFIRVQIELVAKHTCECAPSLHVSPQCPTCSFVAPIRQKMSHLLFRLADSFRPAVPYSWAVSTWRLAEDTPSLLVHRGFISRVRCPLAVWLEHGRAIMAAHPVRRVQISDKEPIQVTHRRGGRSYRWAWFAAMGDEAGRVPHCLPPELMTPPGKRRSNHPGREAALDALSAACIAYATSPIESSPPGVG